MNLLSGPELDALVETARKRYVEERIWLIKRISDPYPYGTIPVSEEEQYNNFLNVQNNPERINQIRAAMFRIYRGHPDVINIIDTELNRYFVRMEEIGNRLHNRRSVDEELV